MNRVELLDLFRKMAAEIAEKDLAHISEGSVIADIGLDSLAMLELVGGLERELKIKVPDEQLAGIHTVEQLLELVERYVTARQLSAGHN